MTSLVTSSVLLETSCGSLVVDLYGADFPSLTGNVINLFRSGLFHGSAVSEVIPGSVVFFSHSSDPVLDRVIGRHCLHNVTAANALSNSCYTLLPETSHSLYVEAERRSGEAAKKEFDLGGRRVWDGLDANSTSRFRQVEETQAAGYLGRKGQLIVEREMHPGWSSTSSHGLSSVRFRFGITLSNRPVDFLKSQFIAIGEVSEGFQVLQRLLRRSQSTKEMPGTTSGIVPSVPRWPRPFRMLRLHRATVLPTAGTERFLDQVESVIHASPDLSRTLEQTGAFEFWAPLRSLRLIREQLCRLVKESMKEYEAGTTPGQPLVVVEGSQTISFNAHFTGNYLSSDDEADTSSKGGPEEQERRRQLRVQNQEKANETRRLMLNILDGITDVNNEITPPDNVLFVCRLNPITNSEGLKLCFSQFGVVRSAEVVMDKRTKQSLCYGFVEFDSAESCERAFEKMDRALLDDSRIHVDFSQSVSKLWAAKRKQLYKREREETEEV